MNWELEELSLNAWPALRCLHYDGWVLRFANGCSRRANSVNVFFSGKERFEDKIAWCEEQYQAQKLPTAFKVTPFAQPEVLDRLLEDRGYRYEAKTDVLSAPIAAMHFASDGNSETVIMPRNEWLDAVAQVLQLSPDAFIGHRSIVQAIVPKICPVAVLYQGSPAGFGLGVLERGMVGLYDLVTDERYRRQGLATRIISAILSWAADQGAHGTYLQVMANNAPAITLYSKMGYQPCYRYWYRVKECDEPCRRKA